MINEGASAGHLLSTDEEFGIEPITPVHFTKQRLRRIEEYEGPVSQIDDAHAEALLCQLLDAYSRRLPVPPYGLPGSLQPGADHEIMDLLQMGFDYFAAVAEHRPRRQVNLYQEMSRAFHAARHAGYDECQKEMMDRVRERLDAEAEARASAPSRVQVGKVYFIASEGGPIKIGKAITPEQRLRELQTGHHEKLAILATCPGGQAKERAYHAQFAAHRLHGEWFARAPEILAEVERLAA